MIYKETILLFFTLICFCLPKGVASAKTNIHKIVMTQKGYIQFLKYNVEVPPLTQFTFCIWLKSYNLTFAHPILSYSQHERDRLLRTYLTPGGHWLSTRVLEHELCKVRLHVRERAWIHVCQSWHARTGRWQVYINGVLVEQGVNEKLRDITIPGGGDIVIGQEYTDFDKGLDDGIEGEIFGFNMVLSSTTEAANHRYLEKQESKHNYQAIIPDDEENLQSEYIRLIDLNVEEESLNRTADQNISPIFSPEIRQNKRKSKNIDTSRPRIVADDFYNIDVDYTPHAIQRVKGGKATRNGNNDHVIAIEYFPDAPEPDIGLSDSGGSEAEHLSDAPSELLLPPAPSWRFARPPPGDDAGFEENQPLALTNLPIYQTPPALPVQDISSAMKPTFEVLYSRNHFKGNEWYDQNNYFPKALLRHLKYRLPQRDARETNSRKPDQKHSRKNHAGRQKKRNPQSDLFPYPSELREVYSEGPPGTRIAGRQGNIDHAVFRRDVGGGQKNIEILNPESVIVYPTKNDVVNVEVFPRSGITPADERDDLGTSASGEDQPPSVDDYMTVVFALDNKSGIKNHRHHNDSLHASHSESSDALNNFSPYFGSETNNVAYGKTAEGNSPNPSYEVLYSQLHYTGNKQQIKRVPKITDDNYFKYIFNDSENDQYNRGESISHYYSDQKSDAPVVGIPDERERLNNVRDNRLISSRRGSLYNEPATLSGDNADHQSTSNYFEGKNNYQFYRMFGNTNAYQNHKPISIRDPATSKARANSGAKRYPENIRDKINAAENDDFFTTLSEPSTKSENSQFQKPVKLGNALNEKQIFREHGNNRETSFVNSDDRVPDINRYRSEIDDADDTVRESYNLDSRVYDQIYTLKRRNAGLSTARRKFAADFDKPHLRSTGRKLVELGYRKCLIDRGSPLTSDSLSLISWTMTPVKMFGGARLKHAHPMCGSF